MSSDTKPSIVQVDKADRGITRIEQYKYGDHRLGYIDYHVGGGDYPIRCGIVEFECDKNGQVVRIEGFRGKEIPVPDDDKEEITKFFDEFLGKLKELGVVPELKESGGKTISAKTTKDFPHPIHTIEEVTKPSRKRTRAPKGAKPS
ncbi:MAG: hypothetical protein SFW62_07600 [Alphaproteobacteria bacterium]|nr:hypothetical protein [Alphaproteobacteria bacterium]